MVQQSSLRAHVHTLESLTFVSPYTLYSTHKCRHKHSFMHANLQISTHIKTNHIAWFPLEVLAGLRLRSTAPNGCTQIYCRVYFPSNRSICSIPEKPNSYPCWPGKILNLFPSSNSEHWSPAYQNGAYRDLRKFILSYLCNQKRQYYKCYSQHGKAKKTLKQKILFYRIFTILLNTGDRKTKCEGTASGKWL